MFKTPSITVLPGGRKVRTLPAKATAPEVLAYADQSEAQAEVALEAEKARPKPRQTVLKALESDE